MPDDMTLQAMVMDELTWVPNVNAAHIGVSARNGVVTLSGTVNSLVEKVAAERAARRVRGVQAVAQEIAVDSGSTHRHMDAEIADRALKILNWDLEVPDERIQVAVEHGIVTLTGTVMYQYQKQAVERDVGKLGGVTEVVNKIDIQPTANQVIDPDTVHVKIQNALQRTVALEATHIAVAVQGSLVTLRGKVKTWWERSIAENAAWSSPGVTEVDNQLIVGD